MKLFTLTFLVVSLNTFAVSEDSVTTNNSEIVTDLKIGENSPIDKSSKENREGKKYNISLTAGKELGISALSIESSYHLKPDSTIYLKYSKLNQDLNIGFESGIAVKLGVKKFTGNSFYYKAGIYYLGQNTKHYEKKNNGERVGVESYFDEVGASVSIGNQWQWDNFSIGADWIGINHTLIELNKLEEPFERNRLTTVSLLNMHIGVSF